MRFLYLSWWSYRCCRGAHVTWIRPGAVKVETHSACQRVCFISYFVFRLVYFTFVAKFHRHHSHAAQSCQYLYPRSVGLVEASTTCCTLCAFINSWSGGSQVAWRLVTETVSAKSDGHVLAVWRKVTSESKWQYACCYQQPPETSVTTHSIRRKTDKSEWVSESTEKWLG